MKYKPQDEYKHKDIGLIATYEELMRVPEDQKVTYYFGDYGGQFFKYGVTDEQVAHAYEKALSAIGMTEDEFTSQHSDFVYRGDIIRKMWDCQLAKDLITGEKVWLIPNRPDDAGSVQLQTGTVESIDTDRKICNINTGTSTMEGIPLHYVLGRWNEDIVKVHYGQSKLEPFYYENLLMIDYYMDEVSKEWTQKTEAEQDQMTDSAPVQTM